MQQTEKYKLNLIETSDTFSPNPLNENMEKVESAIIAARADADAGDAALDQRVQVLEARRIVYGSYVDSGTAQTISLGFTPAMVFVHYWYNIVTAMALVDKPYTRNTNLRIVPGGFSVSSTSEAYRGTYYYLAIL